MKELRLWCADLVGSSREGTRTIGTVYNVPLVTQAVVAQWVKDRQLPSTGRIGIRISSNYRGGRGRIGLRRRGERRLGRRACLSLGCCGELGRRNGDRRCGLGSASRGSLAK